jgi:hypothetical protein
MFFIVDCYMSSYDLLKQYFSFMIRTTSLSGFLSSTQYFLMVCLCFSQAELMVVYSKCMICSEDREIIGVSRKRTRRQDIAAYYTDKAEAEM